MRAIDDRRETKDALEREIAAFMESAPTEWSKQELLRELVKVAATINLQLVSDSRSWQIVFTMRSIMHTADSSSLLDDELLQWLSTNEEELRNETIETLYKPMAEVFGFRPRREFGEKAWHLAEIASSSLSEGLSMRRRLPAGEYFFGLAHPEEPESTDWSLMALLFDEIIDTFFEPVSEGAPS